MLMSHTVCCVLYVYFVLLQCMLFSVFISVFLYILFCYFALFIIPLLPEGGGEYTVLPLSFRPSKIFFVTFFSVTVDGRNLIFGHKQHIGIPYCG
jgi:hypothetical protein